MQTVLKVPVLDTYKLCSMSGWSMVFFFTSGQERAVSHFFTQRKYLVKHRISWVALKKLAKNMNSEKTHSIAGDHMDTTVTDQYPISTQNQFEVLSMTKDGGSGEVFDLENDDISEWVRMRSERIKRCRVTSDGRSGHNSNDSQIDLSDKLLVMFSEIRDIHTKVDQCLQI